VAKTVVNAAMEQVFIHYSKEKSRRNSPASVRVNVKNVEYWIEKGGSTSSTVERMFADRQVAKAKLFWSNGAVLEVKKAKAEGGGSNDDPAVELKKLDVDDIRKKAKALNVPDVEDKNKKELVQLILTAPEGGYPDVVDPDAMSPEEFKKELEGADINELKAIADKNGVNYEDGDSKDKVIKAILANRA